MNRNINAVASYLASYPLVEDIKLGDLTIEAGKRLDAIKVDENNYKVFHHTGWWAVDKSYFEKGG